MYTHVSTCVRIRNTMFRTSVYATEDTIVIIYMHTELYTGIEYVCAKLKIRCCAHVCAQQNIRKYKSFTHLLKNVSEYYCILKENKSRSMQTT